MSTVTATPQQAGAQANPVNLRSLLDEMIKRGASDLHITAGERPKMRIDGDIVNAMTDYVLTPKDTLQIAYTLLTESQKKRFETEDELDFSFGIPNLSRFRGNVFKQRQCVSMVIRQIPFQIKTFEQLNLPPIIAKIAEKPRGLVLVTGPTGSGKSTTLAAMIDKINREWRGHILTVEDPIEFVHESKKCLINQREVGPHTMSFQNALRSALREDPDAILVGELRDLETIRLALTAAETGHLVFATLHTSSAAKTIDRIIDVFPAGEKPMVRSMLSESLRAVISQSLLKKVGGGRIAAHEIMVGIPAIRNLIREDKVAQMYSAIQTGSQHGMQTLDQCLQDMVKRGIVTRQQAISYAKNKEIFK